MEIDQTPAGIVNVEKLQCAKSLDVILQIDSMLHGLERHHSKYL